MGTRVQGALSFNGGLHVDGQVDGNVSTDGASGEAVLRVGRDGCIIGDVDVAYVLVEGRICGRVSARSELWLMANGRIDGDVYYHTMTIEQGGVINGVMHRKEEPEDFPRLAELQHGKRITGPEKPATTHGPAWQSRGARKGEDSSGNAG